MAIALPCPREATCSGYANNASQSSQTAQSQQSNQATQIQSHQGQGTHRPRDAFYHMLQHTRESHAPSPEGSNGLERVPRSVFDRMCRHLEYRDLLSLRQVSRRFYATTDPQVATEESKVALVLKAERHFPQNYEKVQRLGCFLCFVVRPTDQFAQMDWIQLSRAWRRVLPGHPFMRMRRFCIDCGLREGLHEPGNRLDRNEGGKLWVCACRVLKDYDDVSECHDCGQIQPLSNTPSRFGLL